MAIPSVITSGRVVGRYGVGIIDGPDEDDEPELLAAVGSTFTFRPDITGPLLYETPGGESITVALGEFTAVVNADGMLCTPVDPKANPLVPGRPWLRLPGNDTPGLRTTGWTWTVTPRMVTPEGTVLVGPTAPKPFSFTLAGGAEVDLTKVSKAPASPGISVEAATARAAAAEALAGQALSAVQALEENGLPGGEPVPGPAGASAYELAVAAGYSGTSAQWLESLRGADGAPGAPGAPGTSAYQLAVDAGYSGTEAEWLASLKGAKGDPGPVAGAKVSVSAAAPSNPAVGDVWLDISA